MSLGKLLVVHDAGQDTLTVQLQQGTHTQSAPPVPFVNPLGPSDRADLRWYLEDYLRFPVGIYPDRARGVEAKMAGWGGALFDRLFGNGKGRDLYTLVKNAQLRNYDFEVHYRTAHARNFPRELLYDTASQFYLVHQSASFTRCQESSAAGLVRPHAATEQLRVLLVIARPFGGRDVPYRTVARPVMELLHRPHLRSRIHVEVLRPPTFTRFVQAVGRTRPDGSRFFDVVHFDGHGGFGYDLAAGAAVDAFERYQGPHGNLLFETEEGGEHAVEAGELRRVLGQHQVPLVVLNACRSGMEALEDDKAQQLLQALAASQKDANPGELRARLGEQNQAIASVVSTLLDAGAHGAVGMGYVVYARAAALFMRGFYERLLAGGSAAEAVSAGRLALAGERKRPTRFGDFELQDWLVPVYNERVPVRLFAAPDPGADADTLFRQMLAGQDIEAPTPDPLPAAPPFGFLGRDAELLRIERALRRAGAAGVTLVGLGGAGKTALALACARWLAATHAPQTEGGVFFHAFADKDDQGRAIHPSLPLLIRTVGRQRFGQEFERLTGPQQRTVVGKLLREKPCLLVLDNAETVCGLGDQPALLSEAERTEFRTFLREVCPPQGATRLLLTSRREEPWLGLNTEALEVGGVDEEAADELALAVLRHRVGSEALDRKLADPEWQRGYGELLAALGGHPLAIQIILPHLKDRSPTEVLQSFAAGASCLDGRLPGGSSDRERTLAGCVNYSFSALPEQTRKLLPVLAYFRDWVDATLLAPLSSKEDAPEAIRGVTAEGWTQALQQAESTGLMRREGDTSLFRLHPLLPWFQRWTPLSRPKTGVPSRHLVRPSWP
jgi:hypothetical protein